MILPDTRIRVWWVHGDERLIETQAAIIVVSEAEVQRWPCL